MSRDSGAPGSALWTKPWVWFGAAVLYAPIGTILQDYGLFHAAAALAALVGLWVGVARR